MKTAIKLLCVTLVANTSAYAEVITDGSLGASTTLSGQMIIPQNLGTTVGNNLFHSFNRFNINTGESATFTGDNSLKNVISRVTGGQVSNIDGLLQSTIGTANFYFINPAGVTFGANAQVDVPAAFHVSTADTLRFSDGSQFSAANLATNNLSIAEPTGFGFLNHQGGNIDIQGSQLDFKGGSSVSLSAHNVTIDNGRLTNPSGNIQVYATGDTVTDVALNTSSTSALTGRVALNAGSVLDTSGDTGGKINIQGGDIQVNDGSAITSDTLGAGNAGDVSIKGNRLSLSNGGRINSNTSDTGNGGNINIDANNVVMDGQGSTQSTGIVTDTNNDAIANAGKAGTVNIKATNLTLSNSVQIGSSTWGAGHAGAVNIQADNVLVDGQGSNQFTGIVSNTNNDAITNAGNAGTISIKANNLTVSNRGQISSDAWGSGNAGNVVIDAANIVVDGQGNNAWISSNSNNDVMANAGNAGNVSITGINVSVLNNGQISSDTWGTGTAGSININSPTVFVDGQGSDQFTGIASNTNNDTIANAGNAGVVNIKANSLNVVNNGLIASNTSGSGHAGGINIQANEIFVDGRGNSQFTGILSNTNNDVMTNAGNAGNIAITGGSVSVVNQGQISSDTVGSGNAGNVSIDAANIVVDGRASGAWISSDSLNDVMTKAGNAGNVSITGTNVNVLNKGQISSDTWGSGNAGNVSIDAANIVVDGQGNNTFISSDSLNGVMTNAGNAGTVNVQANNLNVANSGQISTATSGTGHAGNIVVNSNDTGIDNGAIHSNADYGSTGKAGSVTVTGGTLTMLNKGSVSSDTSGSGNGGAVNIENSRSISLQDRASISASTSGAGSAGNVTVTAPVISLNNANISAAASSQSQGQTGNVTVTASKAIYLANNGKISLKNDANIANNSDIIPSSITVSAPDIDLKNSEITTESTGNVNAANINLNFSHWLTMDPSFISTAANTGNGGTITVSGGQLIYLQDSGFLTSVSGANSNGGNINVTADYLIMNNGVIQANAVGGSGGDITLNLKALIPSQNRLILGGSKVAWQPFQSGLNIIQAASENGVSGTVNVTSPQFDISASVRGLDSAQLVMPAIDRNLCQSSAILGSTLSRGGTGGIPAAESQYSFIPPVATQNPVKNQRAEHSTLAAANLGTLSGDSFPCASLQP